MIDFSKLERIERKQRSARLQQARIAAGYRSARAAAIQNGWPHEMYYSQESGRCGVSVAYARVYAAAFCCDLAWLMLGEGYPAYPSQPPSRPPERAFAAVAASVFRFIGKKP
ncbi:MAG: hypothetical protein P1V13_22365 [Rhizobiaceae bacterium]|nr:hypothetical protein [Rhizobiaceae bacterium]